MKNILIIISVLLISACSNDPEKLEHIDKTSSYCDENFMPSEWDGLDVDCWSNNHETCCSVPGQDHAGTPAKAEMCYAYSRCTWFFPLVSKPVWEADNQCLVGDDD